MVLLVGKKNRSHKMFSIPFAKKKKKRTYTKNYR